MTIASVTPLLQQYRYLNSTLTREINFICMILCVAVQDRSIQGTLFLTGFSAETCVLSTCRGAEDEGFNTMLLHGSLASDHPERIALVQAIDEGRSMGTLQYLHGERDRLGANTVDRQALP